MSTRAFSFDDSAPVAALAGLIRSLKDERIDPFPSDNEWEILADSGARGRGEDVHPRVAQVGDFVVGYGAVDLSRDHATGQLIGPLVHPDYRRRGLGRKLMQDLLGQARTAKRKRVSVAVGEENGGGAAFLKALKFKPKGRNTCLRVKRGIDLPDLHEWEDVRVRRVNYDHAGEVHAFLRDFVVRKEKQTRSLLKAGGYVVLLARRADEIVGFAELDLRSGETAVLEHLDGKPDLIKKGLGNLLLVEAMRHAFERRTITSFELLVPGDDPKKLDGYLEAGFQKRCVLITHERRA